MQTLFLAQTASQSVQRAISALQDEHVIVAPTDTVYGLMALYSSETAITSLYALKSRPREKAIPVLLSGVEQLAEIACGSLSPLAQELVDDFWPGPLTVIVAARNDLLPVLTAGQPTVAVRVPDHDWLRGLMQQVGPLAATSANRSGEAEAISAEQAALQFSEAVPLIIDGGVAHRGAASTIVDLSGPSPAVLRAGPLANEIRQRLQRHHAP